jgi:tRNA(His) 5'-end guanylyltransferase
MKEYEEAYKYALPKRMPVIIRIDGKAFHTYLRSAVKPFDFAVKTGFDETAKVLLDEIDGAVFAYLQSDEINIFLNTYSSLGFSPYLGNEVQKLCSVSASIATATFNLQYPNQKMNARFDSRCFIVPPKEVTNYFIWRQNDFTRNSIQMVAREYFSQKKIHLMNCEKLHDLLWAEKNVNWNDLPTWQKRGRCVYMKDGKPFADDEIPIFTKDRNFIDRFVFSGVDYEETDKPDV